MKDVVGSTSEEVRMIKAIQRSVGALENGWIGNQTLSDIAAKLGAGGIVCGFTAVIAVADKIVGRKTKEE